MEEQYRVCLFQREWNRRTEFISSKDIRRDVQSPLVPKRMEKAKEFISSKENGRGIQSP
jgi:hypothetical protein